MGLFKVLGTVLEVTGAILGEGLNLASNQVSAQMRRNKDLSEDQLEAMSNFVETSSELSYTVRDNLSSWGSSMKEREMEKTDYGDSEYSQDYREYDDMDNDEVDDDDDY